MKPSQKLILIGIVSAIASALFIDANFPYYPLTSITLFVFSIITIIVGAACSIHQ